MSAESTRTLDRETLDQETVDRGTLDQRTLGQETLDQGTLGQETQSSWFVPTIAPQPPTEPEPHPEPHPEHRPLSLVEPSARPAHRAPAAPPLRSATQVHEPVAEPDDEQPDDLDDLSGGADLLRPFVLTGGRTRPSESGLRVESIIRTRSDRPVDDLRFEAGRITELCRTPRSVAEISVQLGLPLGVTKVLVSDLVALDLVVREDTGEISVALLERILERVRSL